MLCLFLSFKNTILKHKFKIGQAIQALDEDLEGVIVEINDPYYLIETTDGFVVRFRESEIIPGINNKEMKELGQITSAIIQEKEPASRSIKKRIKPKERNLPPMEVDLHIHKLVKNQKGLHNYDMLTLQLETAERQLKFAISKRIPKIVFIHGVGEGVLREELHYLFRIYDGIKFYDADFQKYGAGATEVYIYQNPKTNL